MKGVVAQPPRPPEKTPFKEVASPAGADTDLGGQAATVVKCRFGQFGGPPSKIDVAQLPRPPDTRQSGVGACGKEGGPDSDCQAANIAIDTLPRPPEVAQAEFGKDQILETVVMMFGDRAPEDLPPGILGTWEKLTGRKWGELAD